MNRDAGAGNMTLEQALQQAVTHHRAPTARSKDNSSSPFLTCFWVSQLQSRFEKLFFK